MNLYETGTLLAVIAASDNRRYDDATVSEWQAMLADVTYADALAAVRGHFKERAGWLMVADIRGRIAGFRAATVAELRKCPPCVHGDPGGDQIHPTSGKPLCPLCRSKAA